MLTAEGCLARREQLWEAVPGDNIEWLIVTDPRHVHYLTNFLVNPFSFSAGDNAVLVLEKTGKATLLADNFTRRSGSTPFDVEEKIVPWYDHKHSIIDRNRSVQKATADLFSSINSRNGHIERSTAWLAQLGFEPGREPGTDIYDLGQTLRRMRRQKHTDEVALLKRCMRACEAGHARARDVFQPGMTEFDVYREIQEAATAAAGEPVIVYGDFRATNTAQHKAGGLPTHYELQPGDLFITDFSVVIGGYRSDFTNTYAVTDASDDLARMALTCIEAIMAGEAALMPDANGADVYQAVSSILERDGHGPLKHHAGHGLGMSHPEPPVLVPESTDTLLVGDVITLEPGIYKEGIGGMRFEHNYLITETGFERLSDHVIGF